MAIKVKDIEYKDKGLNRILASVHDLDKMHARVGVLASKGGNDQVESGATLIEVAASHEFGAPRAGIPERSFIRRTFVNKEQETIALTTKLAKMVVTDRLDAKKALTVLGQWGATEVKKTITEGPHLPPPLKQATINRKGSDRPLVDTGRLVGAITSEVVEGDDE